MTYAVAGASGNTGKVVAETLLAQGKKVRVIVRDEAKGAPWRARGAEVAVADLTDGAALAKALSNTEGAYLLIPPNFAAPDFPAYQDAVTAAATRAVSESRVPHVVLLSSVGAQHPDGTGPIAGLYRAERALRGVAGTRLSSLRAAYFMENLGGSLSMLGQGVVPSFFPADFGLEMIATKDIGKLGAQLLVEGAPATQVVDLAGPRVTSNDVAATLSQLTGKPLRVEVFPLDAMVPTLTGMGLPPGIAELYREMTAGILAGRVAYEPGHRSVRGGTGLAEVLGGLLAGAAS